MMPFDLDEVYAATEECFGGADTARLLEMLGHKDWRIRYAAAVALGDKPDAAAVGPLVKLLEFENTQPLYTQEHDLGGAPAGASMGMTIKYPADVSAETLECWRRRARLKQAAIWALAAMGPAAKEAVGMLSKYVTDQKEDYMVRAASARALGRIGDAAARGALERATKDEEWCTKTEAGKALGRLGLGTRD